MKQNITFISTSELLLKLEQLLDEQRVTIRLQLSSHLVPVLRAISETKYCCSYIDALY
jgi:hypothetical protein